MTLLRSLCLALAAFPLLPVVHATEDLSAAEQRMLQKLVLAEARGEGELGMALVARAVLNRTAMVQSRRVSPGTYLAQGRSLREVVHARHQYQPVTDGSLYARRTGAQHAEARRAIALARDTAALRARLRAAGKSPAATERLLNATGFRAGRAFRDASQNYAREPFGNHVFNGDRFSVRANVLDLFQQRFEQPRGQASPRSPQAQAAPARLPRARPAARGLADALNRVAGEID